MRAVDFYRREWRNTKSARYAAHIAGVSDSDFRDAIEALDYRSLNGRLERHEIRQVPHKLDRANADE